MAVSVDSKGVLHIYQDGDLRIAADGQGKTHRIGVAQGISDFGANRTTELLRRLEPNFINLHESNPTLKALINTMLVLYVAGDNKPDGSMKVLKTDVPLDKHLLEWWRGYFASYNQAFPIIDAQVINAPKSPIKVETKTPVVTFSGGKDSTYVTLASGAIPVHIAKMNKSTQTRELEAILRMQKHLGEEIRVVPLFNSLQLGHGSGRYHMRDALIFTLTLAVAHDLGTGRILTGVYEEEGWYSATRKGIASLEKAFAKKGIGASISQLHIDEEEVIKRMVQKYPEAFKDTSPCILPDHRFYSARRNFTTRFPSFPLIEGCCGVCGKDTEIVLSQLMHDPKAKRLSYDKRKAVAQFAIKRTKEELVKPFVEDNLVQRVKAQYAIS